MPAPRRSGGQGPPVRRTLRLIRGGADGHRGPLLVLRGAHNLGVRLGGRARQRPQIQGPPLVEPSNPLEPPCKFVARFGTTALRRNVPIRESDPPPNSLIRNVKTHVGIVFARSRGDGNFGNPPGREPRR
jgi:hypothetical protein